MQKADASFPFDLIVSAASFESAPLARAAKELFGWNGSTIECGIGSLDAAYSAKELSEKLRNLRVLFVGTCGIFGRFSKPSLLRVTNVLWIPSAERAGKAYRVQGTSPEVEISTCDSRLFRDLPTSACLCGPSISLDSGISPPLVASQQNSHTVFTENLELYPVAFWAVKTCNTFDALLATTNQVGIDAHRDWRHNFQAAADLTRDRVMGALQR